MQNQGILQIWAPLYTMFSRGNITEKARILGQGSVFEGLDEGTLGEDVDGISVVDMYAGIGYFVFSYLKRGVKRVWGWEINGWSVEGLRRGCALNGWACKVVQVQNDGTLSESIPDLIDSLHDSDRVVLFHGDNKFAAHVMSEIKERMERRAAWNRIRHVNLGLLPSSSGAWSHACAMIDLQLGGWIHVHENVDVQHIDVKKQEIVTEIGRLRALAFPDAVQQPIECCHIEHVKTYAPGVMHCVFDIKLPPSGAALLRDSN
jgi:tRNA wybutosine-synthesizing protein 2